MAAIYPQMVITHDYRRMRDVRNSTWTAMSVGMVKTNSSKCISAVAGAGGGGLRKISVKPVIDPKENA
jgi:hypothetical protein